MAGLGRPRRAAVVAATVAAVAVPVEQAVAIIRRQLGLPPPETS